MSTTRTIGQRIWKRWPTEISKGAAGERTRRFIISTADPDRDNDTIDQLGWETTNFKKNPVVLWAHDYSQLPVGRALSIGLENGKLVASVEFADHDFANTVLRLIDGGFLNATSVGFRPLKYVENRERGGIDFLQQELLEFSIVPVPANAEALRRAVKLFEPSSDEHVIVFDDEEIDVDPSMLARAMATAIPAVIAEVVSEAVRRGTDRAVARATGKIEGFIVDDPPGDMAVRHRAHRSSATFDVSPDEVRRAIAAAWPEMLRDVVAEAVATGVAQARGRVD